MSTKMTTSPHGFDLADSGSLSLIHSIGSFQSRLLDWLVAELCDQGFEGLTGAMLTFLGSLDCGENHASALARTLGISRQAVHKQVRELEAFGWLRTTPHPDKGNQRVIIFTAEGERMMSVARTRFAALDAKLEETIGIDPGALSQRLEQARF
ncbi:MAG: MarR family winged helix-turn-helix transcriptional regulator [Paracoccaceae bacterium]